MQQRPPAKARNQGPVHTYRCRYPGKRCENARAMKKNGEMHRLCEFHRAKANENQKRMDERRRLAASAADVPLPASPETATPDSPGVSTTNQSGSGFSESDTGVVLVNEIELMTTESALEAAIPTEAMMADPFAIDLQQELNLSDLNPDDLDHIDIDELADLIRAEHLHNDNDTQNERIT